MMRLGGVIRFARHFVGTMKPMIAPHAMPTAPTIGTIRRENCPPIRTVVRLLWINWAIAAAAPSASPNQIMLRLLSAIAWCVILRPTVIASRTLTVAPARNHGTAESRYFGKRTQSCDSPAIVSGTIINGVTKVVKAITPHDASPDHSTMGARQIDDPSSQTP